MVLMIIPLILGKIVLMVILLVIVRVVLDMILVMVMVVSDRGKKMLVVILLTTAQLEQCQEWERRCW